VPWDQHGGVATVRGLIDPTTLLIRPLKPEDYATYRIECEFDPKAKCRVFERMLKGCFDDEATIDVLQEALGAALLTNKPRAMTRALLLWGDSHSGKSNILQVFGGLFGNAQITVPFKTLDNPHGTMPFLRSSPWLLNEAFEQSTWHPNATVKAILAGEPISINIKNGPLFTHTFRGPVFWGSNYPPQFRDASSAMGNRVLIIRCHAKFQDNKPMGTALEARRLGYDHPYELVLETEKPGILNWALAGLARLRKRGYFEQTPEMLEALHEMRVESNYVAGFFSDGHAVTDESCMVGSQDLCAAITMWQSAQYGEDRRLLSNKSISKQINAAFDRDVVNYRSNGMNCYVGVRLTESGLKLWEAMTGFYGSLPPGKHWSISGCVEDVNKPAPLSLKEALALRAQRRSKDKERKKNGQKASALPH
jgi:phage/plasmid-associated DNA primase